MLVNFKSLRIPWFHLILDSQYGTEKYDLEILQGWESLDLREVIELEVEPSKLEQMADPLNLRNGIVAEAQKLKVIQRLQILYPADPILV